MKTNCPKIKENMTLLCVVYGLQELVNDSATLFENNYFEAGMQRRLI